MTLKEQLHAAYLDYVNNFITIERFAEHYGISEELARLLVSDMREYHEFLASIEKAKKEREKITLSGNLVWENRNEI